MADHSERKHALLSCSGASRWLNCTPSARLEDRAGGSDNSVYANEGTLAHELGELELRKHFKLITKPQYEKEKAAIEKHELYSPEMPTEVEKYTGYVIETYNEAKKKHRYVDNLIEEKVDLTDYIEEGFGSCDDNIISDDILEVIDLKYGKGVKVEADSNEQLMLYGLGSLVKYNLAYDIRTVKLTIVQPRLNHISTYEISATDLMNWGTRIVKPKAEIAYKGEGVQQAGKWCRWCKVKAQCATLASQNLKITRHEFKDPHLLTDDQIVEVYLQLPQISDWIKAINEHMLKEALKGKQWAGHKLVEGRSVRVWESELKARAELARRFEKSEYLNIKLKGIGDIEKLIGKKTFPAIMGKYVIKSQGKPTLVPNSDKRPALGVDKAKEDFS